MRRPALFLLAAAVAGGVWPELLPAQPGRVNLRLAQGQAAKYVQGLCPLRPGHKRVESGIASLRKAYDAKTPADKAAQLSDARQNLLAAITQEGQAENGAAWYYLARVAIMQGDPAGSDSAFTRAEALVPSCEIDIAGYRQNSWAVLGRAGIELQQAGDIEGALEQFRDASYLFRGLPHVYANMGVLYANTGRLDSAAAYFEKALTVAEADSTLEEDRNSAAQNLALMHIRSDRFKEAIPVLHKSRIWDSAAVAGKSTRLDSLSKAPPTPEGTLQRDSLQAEVNEIANRLVETEKSLAITFRNAGMVDSAEALESRLIARFSRTDLDSLDTGDILTVGAAHFNAGRYQEAERAFGKVAERNPWSRDARYNLAITHLAVSRQARDSADALRKQARASRTLTAEVRARVADTAKYDAGLLAAYRKLVAEGVHLVEIDPMNEDALRLLAQGQRGLNQDAEAYKTAERLVALPFGIEINLFQMGSNRANMAAEATGRTPMDPDGKPIKVAPMTLVVEFLDAKGTVLDTKEVTVPVLTVGQKHPITLEGRGQDITGWRYRAKPA